MEVGTVGYLELAFVFLIVFLVVGPRRIIRGVRVIKAWVKNGFRRVGESKAAKQGRGILRGFGRMTAYYAKRGKTKEE